MSSDLTILSLASALADHAAARQTIIARNVAHADTPGYRAQDLAPFERNPAALAATQADAPFAPAATRPGHAGFSTTPSSETGLQPRPSARPGAASPNGNTVSLEDQMIRAAEARLQHELALGVWRKSLDILRAAVSPGR
jgi:flagellar basal-body rod protein FlgB